MHSTSASVVAPVPPPINGIMQTLSPAKKEDAGANQTLGGMQQDDAVLQLAKMVSQCGDDIEDIIKARNTDDPKLWLVTFLPAIFKNILQK